MMHYLRVAKLYFGLRVKKLVMYRGSFIMQFFAQGLNYAATFLLMWVMVTTFGTMNGWSVFEVMLLYAVSLTAYGFAGMFFYFARIRTLEGIVNGAFDDILVKPMRTLPYIIITNSVPAYITHLTLAIIMLVVCIGNLAIDISILTVLYFGEIVLCGTFIFGGMFLFATSPAFLFTNMETLSKILFFFRESGYYPISIFPSFMQIIMTVILPYGMINFIPLQPLLGRTDYLMFGPGIVYLAPVIAAVFYGLSVLFFNFCCRRYKSTGS